MNGMDKMSKMDENVSVILRGDQLDDWTLLCPSSASAHPDYKKWHRLVSQHYAQVLRETSFQARPYQVAAAAVYAMRDLNICAGAPGVGKTLIAGLVIAAVYFPLTGRRPGTVQILVPNLLSGRSRWLVDLEKIPALRNQVALIDNPQQLKTEQAPIWVMTYDFLKRKAPSKRRRRVVSSFLTNHDRRPSMLILDEIHNLQPRTQRTLHVRQLRRHAKRCLGLSGTLSDGRFELLQETVSIVYGHHWPYRTSEAFFRDFGIRTKIQTASTQNFSDSDSPDAAPPTRLLERVALVKLPAYFKLIRRHVHRLTFEDPEVLQTCFLPKLQEHLLSVKPLPTQTQIYEAAIRNDFAELRKLACYGRTITERARALTILQPLARATQLPALAIPKWQRLRHLVKTSIAQERKVIIYTGVIEASRQLTALLESAFPHQVVRLYAQDPEANPKKLNELQRLEQINRFQYDPTIRIAVLSINLAAESIDLTAGSVVVFWDLPWQCLRVQQALCRACRPGATYPVTDVYYLTTEGLFDDYVYGLTQKKRAHAKLLLDYHEEETAVPTDHVEPFEVLSELLASRVAAVALNDLQS